MLFKMGGCDKEVVGLWEQNEPMGFTTVFAVTIKI